MTEKKKILIKKYANRRLYNTDTSTYITLEDISHMVKDGIDFKVIDAKEGTDLTRSVLTQIIVEQESKGENILPVDFLKQLIGFYGDSLQTVLPKYLEMSMKTFTHNKDNFRDSMENNMSGFFPFSSFESMVKKNFSIFEDSMKAFTQQNTSPSSDEKSTSEMDAMKDMIKELKEKVDELSEKNKKT